MHRIALTLLLISPPLSAASNASLVASSAQQTPSTAPDIRPEALKEAIFRWPGWEDLDRSRVVSTGRRPPDLGGVSLTATIESGWSNEEAERAIKPAFPSMFNPRSHVEVQLGLPGSYMMENAASWYVYNPVIVGKLAFIEADRTHTGAYTHIFEWRINRWVPVAHMSGPVF